MSRKKVRRVDLTKGNVSQVAGFTIDDDGAHPIDIWRRQSQDGQVYYCCPSHVVNNKGVVLQVIAANFKTENSIFQGARPVSIKVPKPPPKFRITHKCPECGREYNIASHQDKKPLETLEVIKQINK